MMLGNPRSTLDIDYVGDDLAQTDFQHVITKVAQEMQIEVEPVPIQLFIPLEKTAYERCQLFGRFGLLDVYIFDVYSIALSKLDRGFDSDLDDIRFLLRQNHIEREMLKDAMELMIQQGKGYDLSIAHDIRQRFAQVANF